MTISSVSSTSNAGIQSLGSMGGTSSANRPAQLPAAQDDSAEVSISSEAKKLAAAKVITSNPVAVAAVSNNSQVDKLATAIYTGQQNQRLLDTYAANSNSSAPSSPAGSGVNAVAIAAVSDNPQVDKLATTVYSAKQAQKMVDQYQSSAAQMKESNSIDAAA